MSAPGPRPMKDAVQWLRSLVFVGLVYFMMLVIALIFLPWALWHRRGAIRACHAWTGWVQWSARWMVGIRTEVRGTPPMDEVLIAAKHQSFLDIIMIFGAIPAGKFIMKKELLKAPIVGQYALLIGCVPVDRGKRTQAIQKMVRDVSAERAEPGQLIIYPQGTRIAPGVSARYKVGAGVLYSELGQDCVPVACNVGLFWPKRGIMRRPGTAVVEFLPRIAAGQPVDTFMQEIERVIETRSNELMAEAGFDPAQRH